MQGLLSLAAKSTSTIKEDWQKYIYKASEKKRLENKVQEVLLTHCTCKYQYLHLPEAHMQTHASAAKAKAAVM